MSDLKIDVPQDDNYKGVRDALETADEKNSTADIFSGSVIEVDEGKYVSDASYYDDAKNVLTVWDTQLGNNSVSGSGYLNSLLGKARPAPAVVAPAVRSPTPVASSRRLADFHSPYVL